MELRNVYRQRSLVCFMLAGASAALAVTGGVLVVARRTDVPVGLAIMVMLGGIGALTTALLGLTLRWPARRVDRVYARFREGTLLADWAFDAAEWEACLHALGVRGRKRERMRRNPRVLIAADAIYTGTVLRQWNIGAWTLAGVRVVAGSPLLLEVKVDEGRVPGQVVRAILTSLVPVPSGREDEARRVVTALTPR